jgi:hypothetical protein
MKEVLDLTADFISKVGFPIFVAILLLWRDEHRHVENLQAMRELVYAVKDRHLAAHCKIVRGRLAADRRARRPKDKRR